MESGTVNKLCSKILLFVAVFILSVMFPTTGFANPVMISEKEPTLKVFFPLQPGFANRDSNGTLSGYTYDYIMRIAQRTGWNYEFEVYESGSNDVLESAFQRLESGEFDLTGGMVYPELFSDKYEYCSVPYGETKFILLALSNNYNINERTIMDTSNLRVALSRNASIQNDLFE